MFKISNRYELNDEWLQNEDTLPEMTEQEYHIWYLNSWVDGVRIGYRVDNYQEQE